MTCKDCIHYDLCRSCSRIQLGWHGNSVHYVENIEEICKDFKDRSRFVELPCKVVERYYIDIDQAKTVSDMLLTISQNFEYNGDNSSPFKSYFISYK